MRPSSRPLLRWDDKPSEHRRELRRTGKEKGGTTSTHPKGKGYDRDSVVVCLCERESGADVVQASAVSRGRRSGSAPQRERSGGAFTLFRAFDPMRNRETAKQREAEEKQRGICQQVSRFPRDLGAATTGDGVRNRRFTLQLGAQVHACSRKVRGRNLPSSLNWT